jgi:DNA primase
MADALHLLFKQRHSIFVDFSRNAETKVVKYNYRLFFGGFN